MLFIFKDEIRQFANKYLKSKIVGVSTKARYLSGQKYFLLKTNDDKLFLVSNFAKDKKAFNDFINIANFLQKNKISIPKILGVNKKKSLILQEYIQGLTLYQAKLKNKSQLITLYQQALDILIQIQLTKKDKLCAAFDRQFTAEKMLREYQIFVKPYLLNYLWKNKLDKNQKLKFKNFYQNLAENLSKIPRVFCHRDFQSTNLIVKQGKIFVIDFQGARLAFPQYDLVSLLEDNYIFLPADLKEKLLEYYLQKFQKKSGRKIDENEFRKIYNYATIQRKLHDLAIFVRASLTLKNNYYLKYLPRNLKLLARFLQNEGIFIPWQDK